MTERSKAQRRADAAYEKNSRRGVSVTLRLTPAQAAWLDTQRRADESRASAVRRLSGIPT